MQNTGMEFSMHMNLSNFQSLRNGVLNIPKSPSSSVLLSYKSLSYKENVYMTRTNNIGSTIESSLNYIEEERGCKEIFVTGAQIC